VALRPEGHATIFRTLMPTLPPYLRLPLLQQHARSGFSFYRGRRCITIVYDDLLWNALVVKRASKQFDHVHTFHRSTSSVGLAGADGEFPVTHAATELMHDCEEKNPLRFPLLCRFFHFFVHPSGPRLAAPRWVKASYRWSGYDYGIGGEEFDSG